MTRDQARGRLEHFAGLRDGVRDFDPALAGLIDAMVTRLEEFPIERFERVGSREVVQYRDQILPVLRLAHLLGVYPDTEGETSVPVVVYTERGRSVALAVDRIIDIVEDVVDAQRDFGDDGLLGSAVIQQRVTELLDVRRAIMAADPRFDELGGEIEETMVGI